VRRYIIAVILLLCLPLLSIAKPNTALDDFRSGLKLFGDGDYKAALKKFTSARDDLPLIDDYLLLYIAKANLELGNSDEAVAASRDIVQKYPGSLLVPEAHAIELKSLLTGDWDPLIERLAEYINQYPSETEMQLFYGTLLQRRGRDGEAISVLKPLYIGAGAYEQEALNALQDIEFTDAELLERSVNLMSARRYTEAEKLLRSLYQKDNDLKLRSAEKLALTLFRQRKYSEASKFFLEVNDLYNAARSFIRAGKLNDFYLTLDRMITSRDPKGGALLVAFANDVRRDGNLKDSLSLLDEALDKFPLVREDALWNKGWGLYSSGRYEEALPVFHELVTSYPSNKYQYWKARTQERMGEEISAQLSEISGNDFYAFLAGTRTGVYKTPPKKEIANKPSQIPMKRVNILVEAGLNGYACKELNQLTATATKNNEFLDIAQKFIEIQEYRKAISIMTRLPEKARPTTIMYPAAFWPTVKNTSSKYKLDPYLMLSLIREESRFDPKAVSAVGALGLMQLMPETAQRTARRLKLSIDGRESIQKVENNIALGTYYFSGLMDEFKSVPAALAAYNAGSTRVNNWLNNGRYEYIDEFIEDIPYVETRNYVKRIVTSYFNYQISYGGGPEKAARIL